MENIFVIFRDLLEEDSSPHYGCLVVNAGTEIHLICFDCGGILEPGDYEILQELPWEECDSSLKRQRERMETSEVSVPLGEGRELVAEANTDKDYKELFIYLRKDGMVITQDLAIVRQKYEYAGCSGARIPPFVDDSDVVQVPGEYEVLVYGDSKNEDYTKAFVIDEWKGEEYES